MWLHTCRDTIMEPALKVDSRKKNPLLHKGIKSCNGTAPGFSVQCCTNWAVPTLNYFISNTLPSTKQREREIEREREGLQGIFILELTSLPAPDPSKDVKETIPKISFNEYTYHVSHILHLWDMVMYRELKPNSRSWQVKEAAVFEFFLWIQSCRRLLSVHWGRQRENPSVSIFSEG